MVILQRPWSSTTSVPDDALGSRHGQKFLLIIESRADSVGFFLFGRLAVGECLSG
jgi:hypothetical protein